MSPYSYRGKEHVAALIEQMLLSLRPLVCEESRLMELILAQSKLRPVVVPSPSIEVYQYVSQL